MRRSTKIWLGVLTFLPIFFLALYFVFFFQFFFDMFDSVGHHSNNADPAIMADFFKSSFIYMFLFILTGSLISLGLMVYYIVHAHKNPANDSSKKIMWTLILIFAFTISSIVYYFVEILPSKHEDNQ